MASKRVGDASAGPSTGQGERPPVSQELGKLKFEKKNRAQPYLPPNYTIQRRPLNHAPIASPYAGANVQKVVYVSRNTPIMSAVKRVKKLLLHIEKRATQDVDLFNDKKGMKKLAEASSKLAKDAEQVLVKASGRAMEQALKVGEWFRTKEDELSCNVEIRTGSVQAVDDIVEMEREEPAAREETVGETGLEQTRPEELTSLQGLVTEPGEEKERDKDGKENHAPASSEEDRAKKPRRRRKRKAAMYDKEDVPEARIRWIKTIEGEHFAGEIRIAQTKLSNNLAGKVRKKMTGLQALRKPFPSSVLKSKLIQLQPAVKAIPSSQVPSNLEDSQAKSNVLILRSLSLLAPILGEREYVTSPLLMTQASNQHILEKSLPQVDTLKSNRRSLCTTNPDNQLQLTNPAEN